MLIFRLLEIALILVIFILILKELIIPWIKGIPIFPYFRYKNLYNKFKKVKDKEELLELKKQINHK